jgi:hypothetical protein
MSWDGEDRRAHREIRRATIIISLLIVGGVVGGASYVESRQGHDRLKVACGNARGHRALTIAFIEGARLDGDIARELGLPVEPLMVRVPDVPEECEGL